MSRIGEIHLAEFGSEPTVVRSARTVATLLGAVGEHNDGVCLRLVTPPSVHVAVKRRDDSVVRFSAPDLKERKRASLATIRGRKEDRWARLPKSVVQLLSQEGVVTAGVDITLQSEAPGECGLALTAAFATAMIDALCDSFDASISAERQLELMGRLGSHYLKLTPSQTLRLKESHRLLRSAEEGKIYACDARRADLTPCDWHAAKGVELVLISAGVPQFTDDMSLREIEEYQREALSVLHRRRPGVSLRDYLMDDLEEVRESLSDTARRAALFVLNENLRIKEAVELLIAGDAAGLGGLLSHSHGSIRENLDLSCPEIDWLVRRGQRVPGVSGMRIHGLAFGGAALAILEPGARERLMEAIEEYGRIFGFTPVLHTLVSNGAPVRNLNVGQLEG